MDYPIVFIPGLFGSMGDDVIKGTGEFSFGFAEKIYRPFIQILNSMGYEENKNLYISYYDWKKTVVEIVERYLIPTIEKAKRESGMDKVILLGHSLGGLVGRGYMSYYSSAIDKLIMIGTPNLGSVNAYYFWSGGKLPYSKIEDNVLYNAVKFGFILYYSLFYGVNYLEGLRNLFPVAQDLLPSRKYGNYLLFKNNKGAKELLTEDMAISNPFLNKLENTTIDKDKTFIVSGTGVFTNMELIVSKNKRKRLRWADGKPINTIRTSSGDGTVTTTSTLGYLGGNNIVLEGNHTNILYRSKDYLENVLGKISVMEEIKEEKIEKVYVIIADKCNAINIQTSGLNHISSQSINITDNKVQAIKLSPNRFMVMITGDNDLDFKFNIESYKKFKGQIHMFIADKNGISKESNYLKYTI
ncbi:alpha/beta fold hydrolase [Tissierella sp. MB52-C2]|uniref:lipase family alpha/beta hydrolase n=1 Tax=Tissierella sp. MB52-C2 TaxID=3070999 RepID=UPI00280C1878|nr:alpha/beta fold hydrolase [Tissierella sp. MB52-C2]WMM25783.1 alpha/beta fold hydrolase [Tissierella sp. MB52-C2]